MGGKQVPTFRQAQKCGRVKPYNSPLPNLIIESPIRNKQTIKNLNTFMSTQKCRLLQIYFVISIMHDETTISFVAT